MSQGFPRFAGNSGMETRDATACNTAENTESYRCDTRNTKETSWND